MLRSHGVLVAIAVLVLAATACSSDLTRSRAEDLLAGSPKHARPIVYSLREGRVTPEWSPMEAGRDDVKTWQALARDGYIELEDLGPDSQGFGPPFFNAYSIRVTEKGRSVFRAGEAGTWSVEVATRQVGEVTGIVKHIPTIADVEYTWTYEAVSPLFERSFRRSVSRKRISRSRRRVARCFGSSTTAGVSRPESTSGSSISRLMVCSGAPASTRADHRHFHPRRTPTHVPHPAPGRLCRVSRVRSV